MKLASLVGFAPQAKAAATNATLAQIIFEKSPDAYFLIRDGKIIAFNDATLKLLNCVDGSRVIGITPGQISPERQRDGRLSSEKAGENIKKALATGLHRFEWQHVRFDGTPFDVMVTLIVTEIDGVPHIVNFWQDIGELVTTRENAAASMKRMSDQFQGQIGTRSNRLRDEVKNVSDGCRTVGEISRKSHAECVVAGDRARGAAQDVAAAAAAAMELSMSAKEISRLLGQANTIARETSESSTLAQKTAASLAAVSDRISGVTDLIDKIARQTNMLALNATIEAARAGEAGRGFAVVANEVKTLAAQTTEATRNIASNVISLRKVADEVSSSLGSVTQHIEGLSGAFDGIAAAATEQDAATAEIARALDHASQGVSNSADATRLAADQVQSVDARVSALIASVGKIADDTDALHVQALEFIGQLNIGT